MQSILVLLAAAAITGVVLHLIFSKLQLRKRLAPKMLWWTPAALVILLACVAILLVHLFSTLRLGDSIPARVCEGAYLGFWLACIPVFSPNKRWNKS